MPVNFRTRIPQQKLFKIVVDTVSSRDSIYDIAADNLNGDSQNGSHTQNPDKKSTG